MNLTKVYDRLQDDESKKLFEGRLRYSITKDRAAFYETLYQCESVKDFFGIDLSSFDNEYYKDKKIIIYGAGLDGYHSLYVLENSKHNNKVIAFCDSNSLRWGETFHGLKIISPYELEKYKDAIIIIASERSGKEIYLQLARSGFPQNNIYFPPYQRLSGVAGYQYFDLFQPGEHEVFVDAGCYDGNTSIEFAKWCNLKYDMIYAFEPQKELYDNCKETFISNNIDKYRLYPKATWDKDEDLYFSDDYQSAIFGGARVISSGKYKVAATSIDNTLNGEYASFIKMDVEGSELMSLIGAKDTIVKHRPRLAISLYHKPEDIIDIPAYLLGLIPDYKLYLRHYSSDLWETVLYAE